MGQGMNKAQLIGYIGADPELNMTAGGARLVFRLATNRSWKDKESGERREKTEWHNVVMWGSRAEQLAPHLSKGQQVYVEGRIETRAVEDPKVGKRWFTDIKAENVLFIGPGKKRDDADIEVDVVVDELVAQTARPSMQATA